MEFLFAVIIFGIVGGSALAFWLMRQHQSGAAWDADSGPQRTTDAINMAHIRVAGVGGLGLVAAALGTAVFVPSVGFAVATGLVSGAIFAMVLIRRRQATGPMPSSSQRPGANVTLAIDEPVASVAPVSPETRDRTQVSIATA